MKNFKKYLNLKLTIFFVVLIFIPQFVFAESCPIITIGLSQTNQKSKFSEVFALQMILSMYPEIYPDVLVVGNYGPKTETAIKRLQSDNGMTSNGVINADTQELICSQYYRCPFTSMIGKGDDLNPDQVIEVKLLQTLLKYLPKVKYTGSVNGAIGSITEKAITKFQTAYKLYPTQIMDYETNQKLCEIFGSLNTISLSAPVVATKPKTISPLNAVCIADPDIATINQRVSFLSQVFGGKSPYKYYWSGYASGSAKTSSNIFTSSGQYPATLKVTDATNKTVEAKCYAQVGSRTSSGSSYTQPLPDIVITPPTTITPNKNVTIDMTSDFTQISSSTDSINIFWTAQNAETCYGTSAPENSNWDGQLNLKGQKTITGININSGDAAIFTIVCNNKNKTEVKYMVIEKK